MVDGVSIEDMAAEFDSAPVDSAQPPVERETAAPEGKPLEISQDDPDLEIDDDDAPLDGTSGSDVEHDEGDEPALPTIEAPTYWSADKKARFTTLSREAQELLIEATDEDRQYNARQKSESALARKQAEAAEQAARQTQAQYQAELDSVISPARQQFATKWANATPEAWAQAFQHDPIQAAAAKAQFDADMAQMQRLEQAKYQSDLQARDTYLRSEAANLISLGDKDPTTKKLIGEAGGARRQEVARYLIDNGIPADRLEIIAASEMSIAHKAMLYDRLVAKQAAQPKTNQAPPAQRVRAPSTPGKTQLASSIDTQRRRVAQTGSLDDMAKLFDMEEARKRR